MEYTITTTQNHLQDTTDVLSITGTTTDGRFITIDYLVIDGVIQQGQDHGAEYEGNGQGFTTADYNQLERELLELASEL